MPRLCTKCGSEIPLNVTIDGKFRNLQRRKFCFDCSPFGHHNTMAVIHDYTIGIKYSCACGETDPKKFYGKKNRICADCQNRYNIEKGRANKEKVRKYLGGKCKYCGYDKHLVALDIHHTDPSKKDPNFSSMRGWSWERIKKELEHCELVCRNCHAVIHEEIYNLGPVAHLDQSD